MTFEKGQSYRWTDGYYNYKIHIVEVIDEGLTYCQMIVFRYFGKRKQWWHYQIKSKDMLEFDIPTENTIPSGGERGEAPDYAFSF